MLVSGYKKELLIVNDQPNLMAEITKLDSDDGIAEIVWSMAIYDFNQQNITMETMDYALAANDIKALCQSHSDSVGLEGSWHIIAGFSSLGMSSLGEGHFQSPNTRAHVTIDNAKSLNPLTLNFQVVGILING
ncbi:hypothetical protein OA92_23095 [Marinomonas sp. SBI22]|uniref:hypothetical protein n=1 Tax=unclassified Marinomonas TaxID=196814 RepID=UPI0007AFAC37|nr:MULTISPECIES: hypothetical protein [unclassified Marinomonas]KZM38557.1 hypothetical protein OA92_23095 [Marinomonas sp. SBI22]KZM41942.1 hypothetical protein OA91_15925 [Marinomonas sp. SBI8L]